MRLALAVLLLAAACKAPPPAAPAKAEAPAAVNVQAALEQRIERQLAALAAAYGGQRWDEHARLTGGALELLSRYDADTLREIDGPLLGRMRQHGGPYLGVAIELAWRLGRAPTAERRLALDELRAATTRPAWKGQSLVVIGDRSAGRPVLLSEDAGWLTLMLQVSPLGESLAAGGAGPEVMPRIAQQLVACASPSPPAELDCADLKARVEHALGGEEVAAPLLQDMAQAVELGMRSETLPCVLPGVREAAARFDVTTACREPRWLSLLPSPVLGPGIVLARQPAEPGTAPCSPGWDRGPATSRLDGLMLPALDEPLVSEPMASCVAQRRAAP